MGREFELKYRATPEALAAIQTRFGPFREIAMETTYFDALDGGLSRRKWTLRRRLENGTAVCTLKIPLGDGSRGEWETRREELPEAVPELCKLGAPEILAELVAGGITPVCGARFKRLAADLTENGAMLELALDQGVLLGGNRQVPLCEVEVELKAGDDAAALAFARLLAAQYGLVPEPASKLARALALTK